MKNNLIIAALLCVVVHSVAAGDKIDISAVVTKSDAEAILGVPVKDPKGRNKEGSDGFYDSEWSYYAMTGDKALVFDVLYAGRDAPPHLTQTMFSVLGPVRTRARKCLAGSIRTRASPACLPCPKTQRRRPDRNHPA